MIQKISDSDEYRLNNSNDDDEYLIQRDKTTNKWLFTLNIKKEFGGHYINQQGYAFPKDSVSKNDIKFFLFDSAEDVYDVYHQKIRKKD